MVLALAGDSTITNVIPSFASSQLVAELITLPFAFVAYNLIIRDEILGISFITEIAGEDNDRNDAIPRKKDRSKVVTTTLLVARARISSIVADQE